MSVTAPLAQDKRQRLLGHLAMLAFAAFIAGSYTTGAMAVPYLAPLPLNALRFCLAVLLMAAFSFGTGRARLALPQAPWRYLVMGGLSAGYFVSMFIALTMTAPVATSAVFTLMPLMTTALAFFVLRQRAGPAVLASLGVAALGSLWVIFRADLGALLALDVGRGELIFLAGCASYSVYAVLLRKLSRGEPALIQSFWTMCGTALWITVLAVPQLITADWGALPPLVWGVIVFLAIFPTAISFFLVQFASLRLPSAKVTAYGYLTPVFVIVFEGLVGHGWTSPLVALGAAITVLGLVILALVPERG